MHVLRRVHAPRIDAKAQKQHTADNLQVELVLVVVDEIHDECHTEARDTGIDDVADGCTNACSKTIPASFVQRALYAKDAYWSHRRWRNHTNQHAFEHQIDYVDMYRKCHIECKGTKYFVKSLQFQNIFVPL